MIAGRCRMALVLLLVAGSAVHAQSSMTAEAPQPEAPPPPRVGTLMTAAEGLASNGRTVGCRLFFKAGASDTNMSPPTGVYIAGNLAVTGMLDGKPGGSIGVGLVMRDMTDAKGQLRPRPAAIAAVSLIGADGLSNARSLRASKAGNEPGSLVSLFQLEGPVVASVLQRMAREHELLLSIRRTPEAPELRIVIDVSMIQWNATAPKRGSENIVKFAGCVDGLMKAMAELAARQPGQ